MSNAGRALVPIAVAASLLAGAAWLVHVLRAGPPATSLKAAAAKAVAADWVKAIAKEATPLDGPEPLIESAVLSIERAASESNIPGEELNAAAVHAAEWLWHRYIHPDYDDYVAFLRGSGYLLPTLEEWSQDKMTAEQLTVLTANGGKAPASSEEAFKRLWERAVNGKPKVVAFARRPDAVAFAAKRLTQAVKGVPLDSPLREQPRAFGGEGEGVARWTGSAAGTVWPAWHPPADAVGRMREVGAPLAEMAMVLTLDTGVTQPLWLLRSEDPATKKWYILQFGTFHEARRGGIHGGGF